jgi:hypothetical protein
MSTQPSTAAGPSNANGNPQHGSTSVTIDASNVHNYFDFTNGAFSPAFHSLDAVGRDQVAVLIRQVFSAQIAQLQQQSIPQQAPPMTPAPPQSTGNTVHNTAAAHVYGLVNNSPIVDSYLSYKLKDLKKALRKFDGTKRGSLSCVQTYKEFVKHMNHYFIVASNARIYQSLAEEEIFVSGYLSNDADIYWNGAERTILHGTLGWVGMRALFDGQYIPRDLKDVHEENLRAITRCG